MTFTISLVLLLGIAYLIKKWPVARLFPLLALGVFSACHTEDEVPATPPTRYIAKSVQFEIFAARDYNHPAFDDVNVTVNLSVHLHQPDGAQRLLWDTSIVQKPLQQFPLADTPLSAVYTVDKIDALREKVSITQGVTYRKGALINSAFKTEWPAVDTTTTRVPVGL